MGKRRIRQLQAFTLLEVIGLKNSVIQEFPLVSFLSFAKKQWQYYFVFFSRSPFKGSESRKRTEWPP